MGLLLLGLLLGFSARVLNTTVATVAWAGQKKDRRKRLQAGDGSCATAHAQETGARDEQKMPRRHTGRIG
jgi:hypothetical protein